MTKQDFIESIALGLELYRKEYGINVLSVPIAQAILESGFGTTELAVNAHNYFGLKCGSSYIGERYTKETCEEINGIVIKVQDNFRKYRSLRESCKGYLEFLNYSRYSNLKGITDYRLYLDNIVADGYATDSKYKLKILNIIDTYHLTDYDCISVSDKDLETLITETLIGLYGKGNTRKELLGCYYVTVQFYINTLYKTVRGDYGNGKERKEKLTSLGVDYNIIRNIINKGVIKI